jgi:hypothetical protein
MNQKVILEKSPNICAGVSGLSLCGSGYEIFKAEILIAPHSVKGNPDKK